MTETPTNEERLERLARYVGRACIDTDLDLDALEDLSALKASLATLSERLQAAERERDSHIPAIHREQRARRAAEQRIAMLEREAERKDEECNVYEARIVELEEALEKIADTSPNWMQPDAVADSERRMREFARRALAHSEEKTSIGNLGSTNQTPWGAHSEEKET